MKVGFLGYKPNPTKIRPRGSPALLSSLRLLSISMALSRPRNASPASMVRYTHQQAAVAAVALLACFSLFSLVNNESFTSMSRSMRQRSDGQGFANAQAKRQSAEVLFKAIRAYERAKEEYEHAPEYERKSRTPPDWRASLKRTIITGRWVGLGGGRGTSRGGAPGGGSGGGPERHPPPARKVSSTSNCVPSADVHGCKCDVSLP